MLNAKDRIRASGIHFCVSLGIGALAALLVFGVWYPWPYREISGGRELFILIVSVDVVLGPLITLAIFDRRKAWRVMRRDLAVVALLQLAGLTYGLGTVYIARPVHLVFEYNRFRVVHAIDVPLDLMEKAPAELRGLPVTGPSLLSLRPFKSEKEGMDATMVALQGISLASRPDLWQPYLAARDDILKLAKPLAALKERFPASRATIDEEVRASGKAADTLVWVPMVGRKTFWTVLLDRQTLQPVAYLPLDSF